jgi:cell division protein FtsI/penicillin-binding protein 2
VLEVGGLIVRNWDRQEHGNVDLGTILTESLATGAAAIALQTEADHFYEILAQFGVGELTSVDLAAEQPGWIQSPDDAGWNEAYLGVNSFGQSVAVSPLQLLTMINAVANDGVMMWPHVVSRTVYDDVVIETQPQTLGSPLSQETARMVAELMVASVEEGRDSLAQVPGYRVAGKSGIAAIFGQDSYIPGEYMMTFVGFLPAYDPSVSVLIVLDRPTSERGADEVVAPVFGRFSAQLVNLLEIPPSS